MHNIIIVSHHHRCSANMHILRLDCAGLFYADGWQFWSVDRGTRRIVSVMLLFWKNSANISWNLTWCKIYSSNTLRSYAVMLCIVPSHIDLLCPWFRTQQLDHLEMQPPTLPTIPQNRNLCQRISRWPLHRYRRQGENQDNELANQRPRGAKACMLFKMWIRCAETGRVLSACE